MEENENNEIVKAELSQVEIKAKIRELTQKVLPGKCPIRFSEKDGKINWENYALKEPYNSYCDVFKELTATTDLDLAQEIITNGASALPGEGNYTKKYNKALQSLPDVAPRDSTEARLCLQANALYSQGMNYLARANNEVMIAQSEFFIRNAMKLLRLHNETIETLNKHRRGGEQRVVVQHVQVNDGGKAVINGNLGVGEK